MCHGWRAPAGQGRAGQGTRDWDAELSIVEAGYSNCVRLLTGQPLRTSERGARNQPRQSTHVVSGEGWLGREERVGQRLHGSV
jgi:hypothetical protein